MNGTMPSGVPNGNTSNRLLQNFLTESGVSPNSSHYHQTLTNIKDEPSIASGTSPKLEPADLYI